MPSLTLSTLNEVFTHWRRRAQVADHLREPSSGQHIAQPSNANSSIRKEGDGAPGGEATTESESILRDSAEVKNDLSEYIDFRVSKLKDRREEEYSRPPTHRRTWRVQGVPLSFDRETLANFLQRHPDLRLSDGDDNRVVVQTLARAHGHDQVATVRFPRTPTRLERLSHLSLDIEEPKTQAVERLPSLQSASITIDDHFRGITVLHAPSPEGRDFDILAVSGLGSHPFGSFVSKEDGYMWLTDGLIRDIPTARVMIYGYDSAVQDSSSVAELGDLAARLSQAMRRILEPGLQSRLVLVGHSLGGLLIKEALIRLSESTDMPAVIGSVKGCLFFGVPNDGMKIASLIPMAGNRPNTPLIQSLRDENSQVLRTLGKNFAKLTGQRQLDIFCFFEMLLSPTAIKVLVSCLIIHSHG